MRVPFPVRRCLRQRNAGRRARKHGAAPTGLWHPAGADVRDCGISPLILGNAPAYGTALILFLRQNGGRAVRRRQYVLPFQAVLRHKLFLSEALGQPRQHQVDRHARCLYDRLSALDQRANCDGRRCLMHRTPPPAAYFATNASRQIVLPDDRFDGSAPGPLQTRRSRPLEGVREAPERRRPLAERAAHGRPQMRACAGRGGGGGGRFLAFGADSGGAVDAGLASFTRNSA